MSNKGRTAPAVLRTIARLLFEGGHSDSAIARKLGIDRETVARARRNPVVKSEIRRLERLAQQALLPPTQPAPANSVRGISSLAGSGAGAAAPEQDDAAARIAAADALILERRAALDRQCAENLRAAHEEQRRHPYMQGGRRRFSTVPPRLLSVIRQRSFLSLSPT